MRGSGRSDLVNIESVKIKADRPTSICIDAGKNINVWLPKSLIEVTSDGTGTTVTMPEWLAIEKGLV